MPWHLEPRDGEWCVVKEGESSPVPGGCHPSRADAVKHQAALYANEARVAAIYAELDQAEEVAVEEQRVAQEIRVVLEQPEGMTAALVQALEMLAERMAAGERLSENLVAAIQAATGQEIVVNPTPVTVEAPVVNVAAPNVEVHPEIVLPAEKRDVSFQRDAAGRIIGAVVEEG